MNPIQTSSADTTPRPWVGLLAAVTTIVIWSAFIVIARASAKYTLSPLDIAFLRILGASMVLLPWGAWIARQNRAQVKSTRSLLGLAPLPLPQTLRLGLFGGLLYAPLAYTAFFYAPAAHGAVLMPGLLPLSTALVAWLLLDERFSRMRLLGLAFIACGAALVGGASLLKALSGGDVWIGDLLFITASACWASYSVLARQYKVDAVHATIAITVFAAFTFLPIYGALAYWQLLPLAWASHLALAPWREIVFQMLQQGVGSVVLSGISFTVMLRHYGPVKTTMLTAVVPPSAALLAVFFLHEPLYWNLGLGLCLVVIGILLGVKKT